MTDSAVEGPRATDDVDTIIEISTLLQYQAFESELRSLGFKNDMRDDAPVCRYVNDTLTLDVMPTEPTLGFSNRWYPHAHRTATNHQIAVAGMEPLTIRVISAASFVATKLVSYLDRGKGDRYGPSTIPRRHHRDVEDIIVLVDGRPSLLDELEQEIVELRRYVAEEVSRLLADDLEQYIPGHLPADSGNQARVPIGVSQPAPSHVFVPLLALRS